MRRRRRRFRNCWIAIRASPGGASARYASRGMVSGRGSHRPEEQPDPGVGANRQSASRAEGPRLCLSLFVWCGLPVGRQGGRADHADLQYRRHEPSSLRDQQPSRRPRFREGRLCPCRGDHGGAGWHRSQGLVVPCNMTLLALPPTARSSIRSSGFGTICAATGSPTRYFVAWRTSWTPARWRGTGSPPTTAWSAHSARSHGLRLCPLYSGARVVPAIEPWPETKDTLPSRNFRRSVIRQLCRQDRMLNVIKPVVAAHHSPTLVNPALGPGIGRVDADVHDFGQIEAPFADDAEALTVPFGVGDRPSGCEAAHCCDARLQGI